MTSTSIHVFFFCFCLFLFFFLQNTASFEKDAGHLRGLGGEGCAQSAPLP